MFLLFVYRVTVQNVVLNNIYIIKEQRYKITANKISIKFYAQSLNVRTRHCSGRCYRLKSRKMSVENYHTIGKKKK